LKTNEVIDNRYMILGKLGEGGMSIVYKALGIENNTDVAMKFLKPGVTSSRIEDVIRFKKEVEITSRFNHPNIIKIYGIGEYKNIPYIVMELLETKSLPDLFKKSKVFGIRDSVDIIKQLAEALSYVHSKGIIHRDLKPGNIMIRKDGDRYSVKLLDFGLALVMELEEIREEEEIVGTFGYMSPEATGIVNKRIDERSDLYSLGVIFYRLLTGELPFKAKEVSKILHQQVAVVPLKPTRINSNIHQVLEDMVMKLLSKEPELRYQSAKGLIYDLQRYEKGEAEFVIGERDQKIKLTYQTSLVGREEELRIIKRLYNKAKESEGSICLIRGKAGVGKSRLVEEIRGYVYERGGLFIEGRCFDQKNKIPYQPFKDAINEYIRNLQRWDKETKEKEVKRVKEILGHLSEIVVRLNSRMRDILGKVEELVPLEPERQNKRFLMVASKFFYHLVEEGKVCVLFLDDLQWADEGSLSLLEEIAKKIDNSNLFILGTYREEEVSEGHSLNRIKKEAREEGYEIKEIKLTPFDHYKLNRMIAAILGEKEEKASDLTRYVFEKSGGNPFFTIILLRELVEVKALIWKEGYWQENWDKIKGIPVAENMIDVILRRIENLSKEENELLCLGAVIGKEFEIRLLYQLLDIEKEEIVRLVDKVISMQLLEEGLERGKILFVHDRVRDAFYHKVRKEERKQLHLKIARTIEEINKGNIQAVLFDLAHHYIEGEDTDKSLEYVLPAGRKAKESYANNDAIRYYKSGIDLLERKGKKKGDEWIRAKEELAEIYRTTGKHDEAIETSQEILPLKEKLKDKVRIYRSIGDAWFRKGDWEHCEENLAEGLRLLGEKFPRKKREVTLSLAKVLFIHILHCLFPTLFVRKESKDVRPEDKDILWIYFTLSWMYVLSDVSKFLHSTLRTLNIAESRIGKSSELGISLGAYGSLCMAIPFFKRAIEYHQKAIEMTGELKDELGSGHATQLLGFCYSWKGDYQNSIKILEQSRNLFQKIGDMWDLGMDMDGLGHDYRCLGNYDKSIDCFSQYLEISREINNAHGVSAAHAWLSICYIERGNFEKAEKLGIKALIFSEEKKIWYANCYSNIHLGYLEMEKGNYREAIKYLEKAKKLNEKNTFLKNYVICLYPYLADAYIEQFKAKYTTFDVKERKQEIKRIIIACGEALKRTKRWPNHYGLSLRVMAKYYALKKKKKAEKYFLKSIKQTRTLGRRLELAKGYYEYGIFLDSKNMIKDAKEKWQQAYDIFTEIGAEVYMKRCADLLGYKIEEEKVREETPQERLRKERRMATVLNTSRHLSSILNLDELLEKIMDCTIELVGAERGILLLYPEEQGEKRLEVKVVRNVEQEELEKEVFCISRSIISKVEEKKEPLIIYDASLDNELKVQLSVISGGLKSVLCAPIITKGEMLGTIYLDNHLVSGLFNEEDLRILELISSQAGISIDNARLMEKEREMAKRIAIAEERAKYTTILEQKNQQLEEAYQELKSTQRQLIQSEKMATVGTLAGGMAHEINTPLGTILTNTEMLLKEAKNKEQQVSLRLIEEATRRCRDIVQLLLKYSREAPAEFQPVELNKIIDDACLLLEHQLSNDGITVKKEYRPMPEIEGNVNELEQVITNLVLNSRDAIIKAYNEKKSQGNITIKTYQNEKSLCIEIRDNGCGIPKKDIDRIFDPFFTTKDIGKGTGLGLSVSQRIITRHNGEIKVESEPGEGTTVRIELPIK